MVTDLDNYKSTLLMKNSNFGKYNTYYQKRVLWVLKKTPDWGFGDSHTKFGWISIPIMC